MKAWLATDRVGKDTEKQLGEATARSVSKVINSFYFTKLHICSIEPTQERLTVRIDCTTKFKLLLATSYLLAWSKVSNRFKEY